MSIERYSINQGLAGSGEAFMESDEEGVFVTYKDAMALVVNAQADGRESLREKLKKERIRCRTQLYLAKRHGMSASMAAQAIRNSAVYSKITQTLLESASTSILACPSCGEIWTEKEGKAGMRLCEECLTREPDPWENEE